VPLGAPSQLQSLLQYFLFKRKDDEITQDTTQHAIEEASTQVLNKDVSKYAIKKYQVCYEDISNIKEELIN